MRFRLWTGLLAAAATLYACPALAQSDEPCDQQAWGDHALIIESAAPRPGAVLGITPSRRDGPFGIKDVSRRCVRDWRVEPRGAARLSRDRTRLILSNDVRPGTIVVVQARVGSTVTRGEVTVIGANALSVVGRWRRACSAADGEAPVQTISLYEDQYAIFDSEGRQWSGDYRVDTDTGEITFGPYVLPTPEGTRLTGTARVEGDQLTLDGIFFADPNGRPAGDGCPMTFSRLL